MAVAGRGGFARSCLLVAALLAGACTGGSGGPGPGRGQADGLTEGVLRIGLERPASLDPARARFPAELLLVDFLFDGLTRYDPQTLEVRPSLASAWESTPDQKTWLFSIRGDARFSSGRAVTAGDVKYSLERLARVGSDSLVAGQLDLIVGYRAFRDAGGAAPGGVRGITAVAAGLLRIDLEHPFSAFASVLGHPAMAVVPAEAVEAASPLFADDPVGSGPFVIRSRSAGILRLVPAPGARVELAGIEVHLGDDSLWPYGEFLRGRLDWAPVPAERVDEVERVMGRDGFRPYPAQLFYGFNLTDPVFADVRFREAIVRAVNREAIVTTAFGKRVRPMSGLVAEGVPGWLPDACGDLCRYDPERARALLAEVFAGGRVPEVAIDFDDDPVQQVLASAIAANLRAVGIPSELRPRPYAEYLTLAATGRQQLFRLGWIGTYPSPDAFLTPLFYTGQVDNVTGFSSSEVDFLLAAARAEADEALRRQAYQEAERRVLGSYPVIPLAQYETHTIVSDRVEGLVMNSFGTFDATAVRLVG